MTPGADGAHRLPEALRRSALLLAQHDVADLQAAVLARSGRAAETARDYGAMTAAHDARELPRRDEPRPLGRRLRALLGERVDACVAGEVQAIGIGDDRRVLTVRVCPQLPAGARVERVRP